MTVKFNPIETCTWRLDIIDNMRYWKTGCGMCVDVRMFDKQPAKTCDACNKPVLIDGRENVNYCEQLKDGIG